MNTEEKTLSNYLLLIADDLADSLRQASALAKAREDLLEMYSQRAESLQRERDQGMAAAFAMGALAVLRGMQ